MNFYQITQYIQRFSWLYWHLTRILKSPSPETKRFAQILTFITRSVSNLILYNFGKRFLFGDQQVIVVCQEIPHALEYFLLRKLSAYFGFITLIKWGCLINLYLYTNIEAAKTKELFEPLHSHLLNQLSISKKFLSSRHSRVNTVFWKN